MNLVTNNTFSAKLELTEEECIFLRKYMQNSIDGEFELAKDNLIRRRFWEAMSKALGLPAN